MRPYWPSRAPYRDESEPAPLRQHPRRDALAAAVDGSWAEIAILAIRAGCSAQYAQAQLARWYRAGRIERAKQRVLPQLRSQLVYRRPPGVPRA